LDGNLQAAFIEHIAHLTSKDYAAIPGDLVKLGFISAGMEQLASEAGVVEVLTSVYSQLAGGNTKIDNGYCIYELKYSLMFCD
jgi:hypothetical protein